MAGSTAPIHVVDGGPGLALAADEDETRDADDVEYTALPPRFMREP
jgi:hypothetical protein